MSNKLSELVFEVQETSIFSTNKEGSLVKIGNSEFKAFKTSLTPSLYKDKKTKVYPNTDATSYDHNEERNILVIKYYYEVIAKNEQHSIELAREYASKNGHN